MKNFFKNLNYPFVLFSLYLVKSVVLPGEHDTAVLGVIMGLFLGEKLLNKVKLVFDRFFDVKESVISENEFRVQVNDHMGKLQQEVAAIKMGQSPNPLGHLGKRR